MLQNVLLQRGQQPAKGTNPVSPSRESVWFKKSETLELNNYHLLSNLCTMSWQQRSFHFQIQGCCWLRTLQHNCEIKSRPEEAHLPQHR